MQEDVEELTQEPCVYSQPNKVCEQSFIYCLSIVNQSDITRKRPECQDQNN